MDVSFVVGLVIGLVIGCPIGLVGFSLLYAARQNHLEDRF